MKRIIFSFLGLMLLGLTPAVGVESIESAEAIEEEEGLEGYVLPNGIYTTRVVGDIQEIDLANRTAIISGYVYSFVGLNGYERPSVKLYGSQAGSLELLQQDMRVRIDFVKSEAWRTVITLQEVNPNNPANIITD
jgi:hypothetical protein